MPEYTVSEIRQRIEIPLADTHASDQSRGRQRARVAGNFPCDCGNETSVLPYYMHEEVAALRRQLMSDTSPKAAAQLVVTARQARARIQNPKRSTRLRGRVLARFLTFLFSERQHV